MSTVSCSHPQLFDQHETRDNEKRIRRVVYLNLLVMIIEIIGGTLSGSMALLADGFHMATHAGAMGISAFAYAYARRHAADKRYSFGTGKVSDLAGFTSALILGMIALFVVYESVLRLITPVSIVYGDAIFIAGFGLCVNLASAFMLHKKDHHHHDHAGHHHNHPHDHHADDNNYRSAYLHVIADAVTSVMAIAALLFGWLLGWNFMDPVVGIVGAGVILSWTWSLLQSTTGTLLDRAPTNDMASQIQQIVIQQGAEITDLHLWQIAPGRHAAIVTLAVKDRLSATQVRQWLGELALAHLTIEINQAA